MSTPRTMQRLALAAVLAIPFAAAAARAQSPTLEGTVITNTVTATFTDANNNSYDPVSASVSMTVGFKAGLDVSSAALATPASPSTNNVLAFTMANVGNGRDTVSVSDTITAGITVTGYRYAGTTYPTLLALNAVLATVGINAGASITVEVIYDVAPGRGGATDSITVAATSRRSGASADASTTSVQAPATSAVAVTPDDATPTDRLPSNGTQYSRLFTVANDGNASAQFSLVGAANPGLSIVSVNGIGGTSGGNVTIAAGSSVGVTVVYTVNAAALAGAVDTLQLTATSTADATVTDRGFALVRVVKAAVTMSKAVYRDDRLTAINPASDTVLPGEYVQYLITVTNAGAAAATGVQVSDPLPAQVTYQASTPDALGWTVAEATGTVTADLAGSLASGASRSFWIRVRVK